MTKDDWIDVTVKKPEAGSCVLSWSAYDEMAFDSVYFSLNGGYFKYSNTGRKIPDVTHWQPLPPPPEEK